MMRVGGSDYAQLLNSISCSKNATVEVVLFVSRHFRYAKRWGYLRCI
jgi:hypothetical protein